MRRAVRVGLMISALAALVTSQADAGNGLTVVGISNYPNNPGFPNIPNAIPNAQGFLSSFFLGNQLHPQQAFYDVPGPNVFWDAFADWAFLDPAKGALGFGDQTWNQPGGAGAISFYSGHGGGYIKSNQTCQSTSDCTTPPNGTTMPSVCMLTWFSSECYYQQPTFPAVDGVWGFQAYGGLVDISDGLADWGHDDGIHAAFMDMSHGTKPHMWQYQLGSAMNGIHVIGTIMPVWGDEAVVADRGQDFADEYAINPSTSVAYSYIDSMELMSEQQDGSPCSNVANDYSVGGGRGINGCGCNLVIAADTTSQAAQAHMTEDWGVIENDTLNSGGKSWFSIYAVCNWDANKYPFSN